MVKYSLVIPCYNTSEKGINQLVLKCQESLVKLGEPFEIILINDGSSKRETWEAIKKCSLSSSHNVKGIDLFRNFGQQAATMCGFQHCEGDYIITMDDDLQHNPVEIPKLIAKKGHDIVIARLKNRKSSFFERQTSLIKSYFDFIILGKPKQIRLSPFRLLRKSVVKEMLQIRTPSPFVPALMFYITKDVVNVDVEHETRFEGQSNYSFSSRVKLFSLIVINNSSVILKLIGYIGILSLMFSFFLLSYFLLAKLFFTTPPTGWTSLFSAILFFGGLTLFAVGLVGEYIVRIIPIVESKPPFIVRELAEKNDS